MQQLDQLSQEEKIRLIMLRYRSTKDLWTYMTERLGYLLPSLKNCRHKHILDILYERKKVLLQKDVPAKKIPGWPELSVKRCFPIIIQNCPQATDYLPNPHGKEQKLPEREFFWQVMYALMPDQVDQFILQVEQERRQKPNLQDQKKVVGISDNFLNELLKYDYTSTKKGRGFTSLLIERKVNQKKKSNQIPENNNQIVNQQISFGNNQQDILLKPQGVMDVKKWYDQLTAGQQEQYKNGLQMTERNNPKTEANSVHHEFGSALGQNDINDHFTDFDQENQDQQ